MIDLVKLVLCEQLGLPLMVVVTTVAASTVRRRVSKVHSGFVSVQSCVNHHHD